MSSGNFSSSARTSSTVAFDKSSTVLSSGAPVVSSVGKSVDASIPLSAGKSPAGKSSGKDVSASVESKSKSLSAPPFKSSPTTSSV